MMSIRFSKDNACEFGSTVLWFRLLLVFTRGFVLMGVLLCAAISWGLLRTSFLSFGNVLLL
jgi:hypothetical protein